MVESVFGVLFLIALAGPPLAVFLGIVLLALPANTGSQPLVAARHAAAHT
jgi:hypothetical protein